MKGNSPYDYLTTTSVGDLTQDQINSSIASSFVPEKVKGKQVIEIHKVKEAASTFGANGILPSKGAITASAFTDSPAGTAIKPGAGEVWVIDNLLYGSVVNGSGSTNTITIALTDGTSTITIHSFAAAASAVTQFGNPATGTMKLTLTNQLWLTVKGSQSDESICHIPYQMVAM